ncbi:MAG: hypothetical protein JWP25_1170 [Bradyrhizobium sp.]|nr:hypothetical protein [Bradyrhizobium sp.]
MSNGTDNGVSKSKPSYTVSSPPARFSADAKAEWDTAPETIRAEVSRMAMEFTAGFAKYKAAAERDASLAEFHDIAAKGKTTVKEALSKYVNMENQLRADPVKGLEIICQNVGMSLREVAAKVLGLTPDQGQSTSDSTHESVTRFAAENPRFEELSEDIAFFLTSGRTKDLGEAYTLAERLNPAPAASWER